MNLARRYAVDPPPPWAPAAGDLERSGLAAEAAERVAALVAERGTPQASSFVRVDAASGEAVAVACLMVVTDGTGRRVPELRAAVEAARDDARLYARAVEDAVIGGWRGFVVRDLVIGQRDGEPYLSERVGACLAHPTEGVTLDVDLNTPYPALDLGAELESFVEGVELIEGAER